MKRQLTGLIASAALICVGLTATAQDRPRVVAVNHALQHFAERLVGDAAEVVFPVPAEVDPSFWRPSIADISMIQSADMVLLNGAGFATWIDRVSLSRSKLVNTSATLRDQYIVTESITHSHGDGGEHSHEGLASYLWLDPMLAIAQAEAVATAIAGRNLADPDAVFANLAALRSDLEQRDADAQTALSAAKGIAMIATHPRYEYLARRYDLTISPLEWEAGAMPTDAELDDLKARMTETGASVLIWEAEPPAAAFEATAALGLRNVVFSPLAHPAGDKDFGTAFSDGVSALAEAAMQGASN